MANPLFRVLVVGLCAVLYAADPAPEVPDPLGLGPRLALLDHLRSQWKVKTPDQASYQDLCRLYWAEYRKRNPQPAPTDADQERSRARIRELASTLVRRGLTVPANADEATLEAMLKQHELNMNAPTERSPEPDRPAPAAAGAPTKPAAGAAQERPGQGALPAADWKGRLAALWQAREEQVPADAALGWTAAMPEVCNDANQYRYRRNGGAWEYDQPIPEPAAGVEVSVHVTRLEPGGFGDAVPRFQADRWLPGWWDPGARRWTSIPPAQQGWIRDSQANEIIFARILGGQVGRRDRETAWRRLHAAADVKTVIESGAVDAEMAKLFDETANEYGCNLPLQDIEVETCRLEQRYRLVARFEETLIAARNAANGNAEDAVVRRSLDQLLALGASLNQATAARREAMRTALKRLGVLP